MPRDIFFAASPSPENEEILRDLGKTEASKFVSLTAASNQHKRTLAIHGIKHEDKYFALQLAQAQCLGFKVYRFCIEPVAPRKNPSRVNKETAAIMSGK